MIRKNDVQWWVLEVRKHPESAQAIIEELAKRLAELDSENEQLRNELIHQQRRAPTAPPSDQVRTLQRKVETLQSLLDSDTAEEASLVFLSARLQSARLPFSQAQNAASTGRPTLNKRALLSLRCLLPAHPQDELVLLTDKGRGLRVHAADIPFLSEDGTWPTTEGQGLDGDERLAAAVARAEPPRFWTVATRRGYVQRFVRAAFDRQLAQGDPAVKSPLKNDFPIALVSGDRGDILLITRWGQGIRFSQRTIESQGSIALSLEPDDEVVAALALPSDTEILIATASGHAARRDTAQFSARSRPGGPGRTLVQAQDVLLACPYSLHIRLLYLTYSGKLIFISPADVPLLERAGKGTPLRDLSRDPALTAISIAQDAA